MTGLRDHTDWIVWTASKLASQDAAYLPRRLSYMMRKRIVDYRFPTSSMRAAAALDSRLGLDAAGLRAHIAVRETPAWHFASRDVERIVGLVPDAARARTLRAADDLVAGRFIFRGAIHVLSTPPAWDAMAGESRAWTWDLNRHQWFGTLGFAWRYTGDGRYADAFVRASASWVVVNAHRLGRLIWDTPFEVAARVNAWMWAYFLFVDYEGWDEAAHQQFVLALGCLGEYLNQTIEYHAPGNHILLEAKALVLLGELFPEFSGASRWRAKGWRILSREIARQVGQDGVHAERSTMYHRIVAGELAELWLFCRRNRLAQADALGNVVRPMAEFLTWIDQGGGAYPLFGDAYARDTYYRFSAPAVVSAVDHRRLGAELVGDKDYAWWALADEVVAGPVPDEASGTADGETSEATGAHGRAFPDGGYYVVRTGPATAPTVLAWDCGPTGYYANRKHAHLDALALTLAVRGVPLLIDVGTNEAQARKETLRATRAHNTVAVDDAEQGVLAARGEIWRAPEPRLSFFDATPDGTVMAGYHDGYARLPDPVRHTRTIVGVDECYWLVVGRVEAAGEHKAEQRWHVAPGARVVASPAGDRVRITKRAAGLTVAALRVDGRVQRLELEQGGAELLCGEPATITVLSAVRTAPAPFTLATLLVADACEEVMAHVTAAAPDVDAIEVRGPGYVHHCYVAHGPAVVRKLAGGWITDARVAVFRSAEPEGAVDVLVAGATILRRNGQDLLAPGSRPGEHARRLQRVRVPEAAS